MFGIPWVVALLAATAAPPTTSVDVGGHPGRIALDRGQLWVTVYTARDRGRVVRVDPAGNRVTARIPLRGSPFEIAAGAGGVWVTGNFARREDVLHRIDPRSRRVVATIELPGRHAVALTAGPAAVWLVVADRQVTSYSLVRVDPSTDRVVATWPLDAARRRWIDGIAAGQGAVWLLALRLGKSGELPGDLIRFDPAGGRVVAAIDARALALGIGPGGAWVTGCAVCGVHRGSYFAQRVDTATNRLDGRRIVVPGVGFGPVFVGRSRVWFGGYERSGGTVAFRLNPRTGRVDRLLRLGRFDHSGMAFDARSRRLWVARPFGDVLRVDLAGG